MTIFVGCKINQIMEFGDIIYFILLLFFAILGFLMNPGRRKIYSSSRREKVSQDLFSARKWMRMSLTCIICHCQSKVSCHPHRLLHKKQTYRIPFLTDLVTDFEGVSSLKSSIFVYDADDSFAQDDASVFTATERETQ